MYEENKDNPVVPRDAPPAAGAIYWSRQLMSHIEEPMKVLPLFHFIVVLDRCERTNSWGQWIKIHLSQTWYGPHVTFEG